MKRMPARPVVALSLGPSALAETSGLDPWVAPRFTVLAVNHLCALFFPLFSPSACRGSRRAMRARWISRLSCAPSVAARTRTSTRPSPPQSLTRPMPAQRRKARAAMSPPRLRLIITGLGHAGCCPCTHRALDDQRAGCELHQPATARPWTAGCRYPNVSSDLSPAALSAAHHRALRW